MRGRRSSRARVPPRRWGPRLEPLTPDAADELGVGEDDVVLGDPAPEGDLDGGPTQG